MEITVDGALCSANSYPNKPCVSVTVCEPGTTNCQVINDILLDTGSTGLRVFSSVIQGLNLPVTTSGSSSLATCVQFADGSADWGPVATADVSLGGETATRVPIQVIDATFPGSSSYCNGADSGPAAAGFNGILGVGLFQQDCGAGCVNNAGNGIYFSCNGSSCSGTTVALSRQVTDPVALLPQDNNGVIISLPAPGGQGQASVQGSLILGIGTRSDNMPPSSVTVFAADPNVGEFVSTFNGTNYPSFLDTGSNLIYFPASASMDCGVQDPALAGLLCPSSLTSYSAINRSVVGSTSGTVGFEIGNAFNILNSGINASVELGGEASGFVDWGLSFHFGRNVFVGFDNSTSSLGTGPYWAY